MKWFRIVANLLNNSSQRILWLTRDAPNANLTVFKVNLLAVKNPEYAKLAKTCVESFLHFHPKAKVILHYDRLTIKPLRRQLFWVNFFRKGQVSFHEVDKELEWQQLKLELILGMSGTVDLFMDCDLRWNGPTQEIDTKALLYFVEERALNDYEDIPGFLPAEIGKLDEVKMKNTSLFSWSGIEIGKLQVTEIIGLWRQLMDRLNFMSDDSKGTTRISEQIILSLVPEILNIPCRFLKEVDGQFDGSICESSYFGASGGRFAIWGNTIRKSRF